MIKNFEYKIPFEMEKSFKMVLESGNEIPKWKRVSSVEQTGSIEWEQKNWLGLGTSKIKVYLKEPRPKDTLVTVYVSRPLQFVDPLKMCESVYRKLEANLNAKIAA